MNSMSVSHFSVLLVLASLLSQSGVVRSDAGLIQSTCTKTPFPALCISALNSNPKSAAAKDVPHLGLRMVDVLRAKTKAAITVLWELNRTKPDLADPLLHCIAVYNDEILVNDLSTALQGFSYGEYIDAEEAGNHAASRTNSCESAFAQGQSPLTATNKDVHDVATVLAAIAKQLL